MIGNVFYTIVVFVMIMVCLGIVISSAKDKDIENVVLFSIGLICMSGLFVHMLNNCSYVI